MTFTNTQCQVDQLRSIPLPVVLRIVGANPDRYDSAKWHTQQGIISVNGIKFFNWNSGRGGGGAIDLVIHLNNTDFKGAVAWLARTNTGREFCKSYNTQNPTLQLPTQCTAMLPRVKDYLTKKRRVTPVLIERHIRNGTLYADKYANAVFLLLGKENMPVGAELRGTGPRKWHGMAPGSARNKGYFSSALSDYKATVLCESAIDALSCRILNPQYRCISTAGVRAKAPWIETLIYESQPVYCGFDIDQKGQEYARAMTAQYPSIKRIEPTCHDWNDMLRLHA